MQMSKIQCNSHYILIDVCEYEGTVKTDEERRHGEKKLTVCSEGN